jgi:hypothetical protein
MRSTSATEWAELEGEWVDVLARRQHASRGQVLVWEADLARLVTEQDAMANERCWVDGPDDMLSIIGRARREAYHSAILAWLLDPSGRHGLRASLLQDLLSACGHVHISHEIYRIKCEVQREETRADIVAFGPGFTLVIENKVDHVEEKRQCDRLFERFGHDPGARFLFLTPTGYAPRTATGEAAGAFTLMSYPKLARMIRDALGQSAGSGSTMRGREVVRSYLSTLDKEFG